MPGRLRTASNPSKTVILEASYVSTGMFSGLFTSTCFFAIPLAFCFRAVQPESCVLVNLRADRKLSEYRRLAFELTLLPTNVFAYREHPIHAIVIKDHVRRDQAAAEKRAGRERDGEAQCALE
jgi:hypothetical protein